MNQQQIELMAAKALLARHEQQAKVDFYKHLFRQQQRYLSDRKRFVVVRAGRRAGKSVAIAARLLKAIHRKPGTFALYVTLTRQNAKRILWPAVEKVLRAHDIPYTANLSELTIELHGGGTLLIGGCDSTDQIEKYRGLAYVEAAVDECGSFPSARLKALVQDVLRPALMDHKGCLTLAGTPGIVPVGYWYEVSGPPAETEFKIHKNARHEVHHWTCLDNPHLADVEEELAQIREENGWTEESPTYQREYLGIWVEDLTSLVYPYTLARNGGLDQLPTKTSKGYYLRPHGWRFALGVDVGSVSACAFVVVACHSDDIHDYVVYSSKETNLLTGQVAQRIRDLKDEYPAASIILDTGGMGKIHAEEVRARFALNVEAAIKTEKESAIRIFRDRIVGGLTKVLDGPRNDAIRDEWTCLGWNKEQTGHHPDQEDHAADACLYAMRALRNFTAVEKAQQPRQGTREWYEREEAELIERLERRARMEREVPSWDR